MELISVSQQTGDVDEATFEQEKAAGHVAAPMMAGLAELLHTLRLDAPDHNPFVDAAPAPGEPFNHLSMPPLPPRPPPHPPPPPHSYACTPQGTETDSW